VGSRAVQAAASRVAPAVLAAGSKVVRANPGVSGAVRVARVVRVALVVSGAVRVALGASRVAGAASKAVAANGKRAATGSSFGLLVRGFPRQVANGGLAVRSLGSQVPRALSVCHSVPGLGMNSKNEGETVELDSLHELRIDELKDLYSAENQILKALPKMTKAATDPDLKKAFTSHEKQTREHVARLERIFQGLGESPKGKKCVGMEGLIEEGSELIKEKPEPDVLDAGLISKAQHVEHYEMAGYGTVRAWAEKMGHDEHVRLLEKTLEEEKKADLLLSRLAERINVEAAEKPARR
jgi:ferritin-like metal-binding protein YciE